MYSSKKNNVTWRVKIPMKKYITTFWMGHFLTQSQSLCCLNNKANHRSVKWELPNGRGQGCNTWFWMIMYSFKNSFFFCKCVQSASKDRAPSVLDLMKHGLKYYIILIDLFFFQTNIRFFITFCKKTGVHNSVMFRFNKALYHYFPLYTIIFKNYWLPLENIYSKISLAKVTMLLKLSLNSMVYGL